MGEWGSEGTNEQAFYDAIRHYIISLLAFIGLYFLSYVMIAYYKKKREDESDEDDDLVYRTAHWLCCFTMTVSIGAVLLLPFSILSNEILLLYPNSHYIKWLNDSLIHGLWNQIFLGTYISLFLAMPFAYFFTESEGFAGSKKGIKARLLETFVVLMLVGVLASSLLWVSSALFFDESDNALIQSDNDLWLPYLPFVYSCISLCGVLLLLVCTPLGVARLFTVLGHIIVKPQFLRDVNSEIYVNALEQGNLQRKIQDHFPAMRRLENGGSLSLMQLQQDRVTLEHYRDASAWERNCLYPISLVALLLLTALCVFMVCLNCLRLLFVKNALPLSDKYLSLGKVSFSTLGPLGAMLEIVLIFYIMAASIVGLYGIPFFCSLRPHNNDTAITKLIANCVILLVLSSALPVLSRTLGITHFDLMGEFGRLDWLGNYQLVLFYNLLFATSTSLCLVKKFTAAMRKALFELIRHSSLVRWLESRKRKVS